MKKLKRVLWVLLGVAASIALWSCGEEDYLDNHSPHPFKFYVVDESGASILVDKFDGEIMSDDYKFVSVVEGRCRSLDIEKDVYNDERIYIEQFSDEPAYVMINPFGYYSQITLKLFPDDTEEIALNMQKYNKDWYKIKWEYKGVEVDREGITLVRHDDGTYSLKE